MIEVAKTRKIAVFTIVVQVPEGESYEYATVDAISTRAEYLEDIEAYQVLEYEVRT